MDFQREFAKGLLRDSVTKWPRFHVHSSNVRVSLRQALEASFPVVRQLLGNTAFEGLSSTFVAERPPLKGWLSAYGVEFPAFVGRRCARPEYLADVARLEWARVFAAGAPFDEGLDLQWLAALPPTGLERQRLRLTPATSLLEADFPVFDIWAAHQGEDAETRLGNIDLSVGRQTVLVCRPEPLATMVVLLEQGDAALLKAANRGADLAAAFAAAVKACAAFDLSEALPRLCDLRALTREPPLC